MRRCCLIDGVDLPPLFTSVLEFVLLKTSRPRRNMSRFDRLFQAAHDFNAGRNWPPPNTGVRGLWDQVRFYFYTVFEARFVARTLVSNFSSLMVIIVPNSFACLLVFYPIRPSGTKRAQPSQPKMMRISCLTRNQIWRENQRPISFFKKGSRTLVNRDIPLAAVPDLLMHTTERTSQRSVVTMKSGNSWMKNR
jgi:hypothetical protein